MKKIVKLVFAFVLIVNLCQAQDSMYVHQKVGGLLKLAISNIDSVKYKTTIPDPTTVTDFDGNVYHSVQIGSQIWMVENLKTTHYNDGSAIFDVTDPTSWNNLAYGPFGGYCWYNNDVSYKNISGALYNWYAVNTGKLAPSGWRVPTSTDWVELINYLGGSSVAGSKLMQTGTSLWLAPNNLATNETGFTALPSGVYAPTFQAFYQSSLFWSSQAASNSEALYWAVGANSAFIGGGSLKRIYGLSIRCIKN